MQKSIIVAVMPDEEDKYFPKLEGMAGMEHLLNLIAFDIVFIVDVKACKPRIEL